MRQLNSQSDFVVGKIGDALGDDDRSHQRIVGAGLLTRSLLVASVSVWALALNPSAGHAAAATTTSGSAQPAPAPSEIVVTAQRHAQSVLSVPMSISAVSGKQLDNTGIRAVVDLQAVTPGLYDQSGSGQESIYIRGIGNNIRIGADPSVAVFIDDVPRLYGHMFTQFVDVDRVEVLKGAQGGLYGRNATGGVINIITRQPSASAMFGGLQASYGQLGTYELAGYVNVPVNDKVALFVAAERDAHDPYTKNISTNPTPYSAANFPTGSFLGTPQQTANFFNSGIHPGKGTGNQNIWAVDAKLLLKPTDNFKITIAGDYEDESDSQVGNGFAQTPAYGQAVLEGIFHEFGINAVLPPGFLPGSNGPFTNTRPFVPVGLLQDYGASATAVYSARTFDLTSITAYRGQIFNYYDDLIEAPVSTIADIADYNSWFVYQELRASSTGAGPIHWIGGATYLSDHVHSLAAAGLLLPLVPTSINAESQATVQNWSVYGQIGYDFTPDLNLTVSGRYIDETNTTTYAIPLGQAGHTVESKFIPSVTLSYKLDGGGTAYARFAEGFKTGGVNTLQPPSLFPNPNQGAIFGGETVNTYEVGYRAPLFDRKVSLTAAVFYNDYQNLQVLAHAQPQYPLILAPVVNGGNARTYGAEASMAWRVTDALTLGFNAAYLNAKYRAVGITDSPVLEPFSLNGQTMINSPEWQLSFTGNVDQPLNDKFKLVGDVVASYASTIIEEYSGFPGVLPNDVQPGYWLVNARIGVQTTDDRYAFSIIATNLFNQGYITAGSSLGSFGNLATWGSPRIVRAEIAVKF